MAALVTGILTLTPTHPGSGQSTAAVDLPIARDPTTGFPILPATALKGVARAALEKRDPTTGFPILPATALKGVARAALEKRDPTFVTQAFGPELEPGSNVALVAGTLVFGEGQLLVYPLRALHRPVVYATCPLLLQRWDRALRAFGGKGAPEEVQAARAALKGENIQAAPATAPTGAFIVEDVALPKAAVRALDKPATLATYLGSFLPDAEADLRAELQAGLVLLSDDVFATVLRRAIPVQTRIRLNDKKTTTGEGGNLWYEEYLPSEVLFGAIIAARNGRSDLDTLETEFANLHLVQLGGNETVGMGRVAWTRKETLA